MSVLVKESDEPITDRRQLIEYFAHAGRPKSEWLIGVEHEKFPFRLKTRKPVSYEEPQGMRDLFQGFSEYGWQPQLENGNVIGLTRGKAAISFEPGGQVELAGAPWQTMHDVAQETSQHMVEANALGEKLGIGFLGIGFHPTAKRDEIPWVPKDRYRIMRNYMPKKGSLGLDMMVRTCTVQVNLDYANEADMVKKLRIGLALQPVVTALFASSPFTEGKPNGWKSMRMHIWQDTDPDRTGNLPFAFDDGFGFERYTDYALGVPMYFVYRDGKYIDCTGQSFRTFMDGKLPALPGARPTLADWANHLTTLFPDVRLKKVIEMRGADMGSFPLLLALPSFWTGILYDETASQAAWDLTKNWTTEDRKNLHNDAPRHGFNCKVKGRDLREIAHDALVIAREGLRRRAALVEGLDETRYLDVLFAIAESGQSYADKLLNESQNSSFITEGLFEVCRLRAPNV